MSEELKDGPFAGVKWVWMNGRLVPFGDAKIHVLSHALHYGSGAFEGVRCYKTPSGSAVFRLPEHLERLVKSCKIYRMEIPFDTAELTTAVMDTILANELEACYVRPIAYRGFGTLGVNPLRSPVDVAIGVWSWGAYLGDEALQQGVDACVSSWRRVAPSTVPTLAKSTGNYLSSQLIKMEALANGYVEGIALDAAGLVSEGSGENIFAVLDGRLFTPPLAAAVLPGITRKSVMRLAKDMGIKVVAQTMPREMLYTCDELFFTGTAAEITPIRSVDRISVGAGRPGPITLRLSQELLGIMEGRIEDRYGWLSPVPAAVPA